ncbi:MAG: hypothetical protein AMJ78_05580 [Omnitrophica WOR_2 bacterium SM23_29]|nr:MAG: hypothetical protein AMJ78_05580 [Omnitrophica WOR_2 bacterium SM23_29]
MATYKKIIELISRYRTPKPSKEFWQEFDKGLRQRLDAIDEWKSQRRSIFVEKIKDILGTVFQPTFRPAVVAVSLIILIIGVSLFFTNYQAIQQRSIAGLSDEELINELVMIEMLFAEGDEAAEKIENRNDILNELRLLYELDPSLFDAIKG